MITIGLTGSIAMGKSTISKYAQTLGIEIIDADIMAKQILFSELIIKDKFPEAILNGQIDTKIMAQIVFADSKKILQLESIIYPILTTNIVKLIENYKQQHKTAILIDAPKLFEAKLEKLCNYVITVYTTHQIQFERIKARQKYSELQIKQILANQIDDKDKIAQSDFVIDTSGDIEKTYSQFRDILAQILT